MGYPDSIRVYVTPHQRETLEFLVNRRINDIEFAIRRAMGVTAVQRETWRVELETLRDLKAELLQAGT